MVNLSNNINRPYTIKPVSTKKKTPYIYWAFLIIFSPFLIIWEAIKKSPSRKSFYAYLALIGIIMILTSIIYLYYESRIEKVEKMLGQFIYPEEKPPKIEKELQEVINRYAVSFNISPQLISAIIQVESSFNPNARSSKGACGLMQITPGVWKYYNKNTKCDGKHLPGEKNHGRDCIYAIEANIRTGVILLRDLIKHYDGEIGLAIEAYNAGLTNVNLNNVRPKYKETRDYLHKIATVIAPQAKKRISGEMNISYKYKKLFKIFLIFLLIFWGLLIFWVVRNFIN